jgi:Zn-dependent protease with chaperone function
MTQLSVFLLLFSGVILMVVVTTYLSYSGLVARLRGATEGHNSVSPFEIPLFLLTVLIIVGGVGVFVEDLGVILFSTISLYVLAGSLVDDSERFAERCKRVYYSNPLEVFPPVAGEYLIISLPAAGPWIVLVFSHKWITSFLFFLLPILILLVVGCLVLLRWITLAASGTTVLDAFYDVKQKKTSLDIRRQLVVFAAVTTVSFSMFGIALYGVMKYAVFFRQPLRTPLLLLLLLIVSAPISYFAVGLVYQTVHGVREKYELFAHSTPMETNCRSEALIMKLDSDRNSPVSLSTGFNSYVFIPSATNAKLEPKEREAIIRHEEKHIQSGEAFLFLIIPIVSLTILTGQNVLYSLLNFRERELEADRFAKEKVGREAVESALQTIAEVDDAKEARNSWWQEHFGMFYGTFAQSEAHPGVSERIKALRD